MRLLCCAVGLALGVIAQDAALENEALRLSFTKSPAGIATLVHRGSGNAVVDNKAGQSLFIISTRKADGDTQSISSREAGKSGVRLTGDGKALLTFSDFPGTSLQIDVEVELLPGEPLTQWTMRVRNPDRQAISFVRFPMLPAVPKIGESEADDVVVLPLLPGALCVNPRQSWKLNAGVQTKYPGDMSAQFLAYQDRTAGLFFGTRDIGNHPRSLSIWKRADYFDVYHEYNVAGASPEEWSSPYPTVVGVTQGRWFDSADLYKRWAVQQPWCAKKLTERDDIPAYWKAGPLIYTCAVRTFGKDRVQTGSYYPQMHGDLRYLRGKVDGPIVAMLASWEKNRRWSGGDYFPVFDHEQAKRVIGEMRQDGFRSFFFLSGLYYTFDNIGVNGGPVPAAKEHMDGYVLDEQGKPSVYTLNGKGKTGWKRLSYEVCPGSSYARQFCHQIIDNAHALGVDMLQMDQTVSGASHACWAKNHDHPLGEGAYRAEGFHRLLADMRRYGKAKTPDFVLFHEEPHEELIPYLDGFHMREYKEKWWYRSKPGLIGIPLFSYLYHEYAIGYGGDNCLIGPRSQLWNTRCHAVNLVSGKTPGASVWSNPKQLHDSHPAPLTMARHHCQLLKTRAGQCLMLGTMLHPLELDVPKQAYRVWTTTGGKGHMEDFVEPAVLTSSWLAPDGSVGHVFANPTEKACTLTVAVDTRNQTSHGPYDVSVYTSETNAFAPLWQKTKLPRSYTTEIPSLGVVFVEVRRR